MNCKTNFEIIEEFIHDKKSDLRLEEGNTNNTLTIIDISGFEIHRTFQFAGLHGNYNPTSEWMRASEASIITQLNSASQFEIK